jgi:hypothetical protein
MILLLGLGLRVNLFVIFDPCSLRESKAPISERLLGILNLMMAANLWNLFKIKQVILIVILFERFLAPGLSFRLDLIDPFELIYFLVSFLNSEVSQWAHLGINEGIT